MSKSTIAALTALLLASAAGCTTKTTHVRDTIAVPMPTDDVVIASYEVPAGKAETYRSMLHQLLLGKKKGELFARVGVLPDGRIAVVGSKRIQAGVAKILASMKQMPAPPDMVGVTYWVVAARAAPELSLDPSLQEISATLAELSKREGGLAFRAVDRVAVRSSNDAHATHDGRRTEIRQTVRTEAGTMMADVSIRSSAVRSGALNTRVPLPPNEPIVIGETGVEPELWPEEADPARTRIFYVVRARVDG